MARGATGISFSQRAPALAVFTVAVLLAMFVGIGVGRDDPPVMILLGLVGFGAAILAARADIREEIDRLRAHVEAARALLATGGPIGRRLDFLSQEFNRESNTICSKSNSTSLTAIGLELKVVIDQFREQVQNIE